MNTQQVNTSKFRRKRSAAQRAADMLETERMILKGFTQTQIAAELSRTRPYSLARSQISYDVAKIEKNWRESATQTRNAAAAKALRKLELLGIEAWESYEESKGSGAANPQWLRVLIETHDRICRIAATIAQAVPVYLN